MADLDPKSKVSSDVNEGIKNLKSFTAATQAQKEAIKEVVDVFKELNKSYQKINDYSNSLNKSTLNTKKLQRELEKSAENKLKSERQLATFNEQQVKQFNKDVNAELKIQEKIRSGLLNQNQLRKAYGYLSTLQNDLEYQMYKTSVQSVKQAEEGVEAAQSRLVAEKKIEKSIGLTGIAIKQVNRYTGLGKDLYAKMVEEAREGEATTKKWVLGLSLGAVAISAMGSKFKQFSNFMGKTVGAKGGGTIGNLAGNVTGLISKIPLVGPIIGGMVDSFANLLDFAVGAASNIQKMGREVGLTKDQSIQLNNQFSNFATMSGKAYLNSENLFKTYLDISKVLGVNNQISKENLQTQVELNKFLGVDAETSAEIEKSSLITGRSSKDIAQNIYSQTKNLERATGISFNFQKILKEATSLGGVLGLSFSKYPEKITKALVATKAMGLELKQLDGMADSFLDFESSISKEFEAQLLTGKEINLAKAREAFLNNDLVTAAEEITKQVGDSNDFLSMNRIQQESIAAAMGMSRDQMADMLKQQEYLSKFGAKDVKDLHEKVRLLRLQGKEQEAINLLGDKEAYNKMVTATASEDLAGFIDKIKQSFADLISNTGLADFVTETIAWLSKPGNIMKIVNGIKDVFASIVSVTGSVVGGIMRFLNYFPGIDIDESMIDMVEGAGAKLQAVNLGSLSVGGAAAKDKAGGGGAVSGGGDSGGSKNYSSAMGNSIPNVSVKIQDRELFVVSYTGYNQGSNSDQQMTTKNISNPTQ
jgi:hypothetical protein